MIKHPSALNFPVFLMNFPFTVDNICKNNIWMENFDEAYNHTKAFDQFMGLYREVTKDCLVYLLPSEGNFQDQTFVANLGCYLPHLKHNIILLANFRSDPRKGEDIVGRKFFESLAYGVAQPPYHWEGEADLKWLRHNLYIGGHGIRSDIRSYYWMMDNFDMEVLPIKMDDPKLYHLDCLIFPLTKDRTMVATKAVRREDLKKLEKFTEVLDIPPDQLYNGWTNSVRIGKRVLHAPASGEDDRKFRETIFKMGFEPVIINLGEYEKSGADLSCMLMHLNYVD
jgi:N-dimethylarginine dimethylaminohydrolase